MYLQILDLYVENYDDIMFLWVRIPQGILYYYRIP